MHIDRAAQFQPMTDLIPKAEAAAADWDKKTNDLEAQQALVKKIEDQMNQLRPSIQQWGGGTPAQFIEYFTLQMEHDAEYPKIATLFQAASDAHVARMAVWNQGYAIYNSLRDNPGSVENTGGTLA